MGRWQLGIQGPAVMASVAQQQASSCLLSPTYSIKPYKTGNHLRTNIIGLGECHCVCIIKILHRPKTLHNDAVLCGGCTIYASVVILI